MPNNAALAGEEPPAEAPSTSDDDHVDATDAAYALSSSSVNPNFDNIVFSDKETCFPLVSIMGKRNVITADPWDKERDPPLDVFTQRELSLIHI